MKYLLYILSALWFLTILSCRVENNSGDGATLPGPNFIVIMADDCTFRDLEVYGGQARTPNLLRFAEEGMKFNRCFQATAMCSPTRQHLLTGIYPVRNGGYANHTFCHEDMKSITHHLQPAGYRVALTGKRHIGPSEVFPFEYSEASRDPDLDFIDQFIGSSKGQNVPFCLFAMCSSPHVPWTYGNPADYPINELELPPYLIDTEDTRKAYARYLAEISYFDEQVGQILERIDRHDIRENTLVMVLSEHGSLFPFEKWTCYDAGLRSAMIIRYPGLVEPGTETDAMVEYVDVVPTLLDLAGTKPVIPLDGQSFKQVLNGEKETHKKYVFGVQTTLGVNEASQAYGIRSVRNDTFKYIVNLFPENEFENALLMDPEDWSPARADYLGWVRSWRSVAKQNINAKKILTKYQKRPAEELYDIQEDPFELNNLAKDPAYRTVTSTLSHALEKWMETQGDAGRATELKIPPRTSQ